MRGADPALVTLPAVKLRPFTENDWIWLFEYESDPENARYQSYAPRSEADSRAYVHDAMHSAADAVSTVIEFVAEFEGTAVGRVGLLMYDHYRQANLWYSFGRAHQGAGLATAAVRQLLKIGFGERKLHRIQADCDAENGASIRLLERIGFRREAHHVESYFNGEHWRDSIEYAQLSREWSGNGVQSITA